MAVNETVGINLVADTKSFRAQFKEASQDLQKIQATFGEYSKEALQAAKNVANLKDRIQEARETVDLFDPGKKLQAVTGVVNSVAGAYAGLQGAMALVGVESEDVQKQLLKVQGALALSQGVSTVLDSAKDFQRLGAIITTQVVPALSTLRGAIIATGLGALAVTLAAGYYLWDQYGKAIEEVNKKLKRFQDDTARGAKTQKDGELAALERLRKNAINEAKINGAKEQEISDIEQKFARLKLKTLARFKSEVAGNADEEKQAEKELTDAKSGYNDIQVANKLKAQERQLRISEERAQKEVEVEQKKADRLAEINKKSNSDYENKVASLTDQYQSDLELFSNNEKAKYFITKQFEDEKFKLFRENRAILNKEDEQEIEIKIERLEAQGAKDLAERNKTASIITKSMDASLKKNFQNEIDAANALKIAKINIAADTLGILSGFAEQGSGLQKGLALTQIAIDTGVAISGLTASTSAPSPDNLATGGLSGFAKYAAGLIKILSNIAQAKNIIQSASSGGGSSPIASAPNTIAPIVPQYQAPMPTALDAASLNTINNVVARAYVVESDITGTQKRIRRIENAARI
jgi:hypothetical protein